MLYIKSKSMKKAGTFDYSSTQINLPHDEAQRIINWGKKVIPEKTLYKETGERTFGREDDIHCTAKFGLHTNDVEVVKNQIKDFKSFIIKLDEVSRFIPPDEPYDVVKIAVKSDELSELHRLLGELENSDQHPKYNPHITIAYVKSGTNAELSGKRPFGNIEIPVSEIVFSPKDGDKIKIALRS